MALAALPAGSRMPLPISMWPPRLTMAAVLIGGSEKSCRSDEVPRPAIDLGGRSELGDPALAEGRGGAAEEQRLDRLGGRIDHDAAAAGEELRQLVAKLLAKLVVEIGQGLVEQDEVRLLDQRAGNRRPLLLASGEFGGTPLQHRPETEQLRGFIDPALDLLSGQRRRRAAARRCSRRR